MHAPVNANKLLKTAPTLFVLLCIAIVSFGVLNLVMDSDSMAGADMFNATLWDSASVPVHGLVHALAEVIIQRHATVLYLLLYGDWGSNRTAAPLHPPQRRLSARPATCVAAVA